MLLMHLQLAYFFTLIVAKIGRNRALQLMVNI